MAKIFGLLDKKTRYEMLEVTDGRAGSARSLRDENDIAEATARLMNPLWLRKPLPAASGRDQAAFVWTVRNQAGTKRVVRVALATSGNEDYSKTVRSILSDIFRSPVKGKVKWSDISQR